MHGINTDKKCYSLSARKDSKRPEIGYSPCVRTANIIDDFYSTIMVNVRVRAGVKVSFSVNTLHNDS